MASDKTIVKSPKYVYVLKKDPAQILAGDLYTVINAKYQSTMS